MARMPTATTGVRAVWRSARNPGAPLGGMAGSVGELGGERHHARTGREQEDGAPSEQLAEVGAGRHGGDRGE